MIESKYVVAGSLEAPSISAAATRVVLLVIAIDSTSLKPKSIAHVDALFTFAINGCEI